MKKRRCQLCGGKIRRGRCELCGWVNQEDREYLLNKSACDDRQLTHSCDDEKTGKKQKAEDDERKSRYQKISEKEQKQYQKFSEKERKQYQKAVRKAAKKQQDNHPKKKKKGSCLTVFILLIILGNVLPTALELIWDVVGDEIETVIEKFQEKKTVKSDWGSSYREDLPEFTGKEQWEQVFYQGCYIVGVDLPEGIYRADYLEGWGSFTVEDEKNDIYLYAALNWEPEKDEYKQLEDLRLYEGALVTISGNMFLTLSSDCAGSLTSSRQKAAVPETVSKKQEDSPLNVGVNDVGMYDLSVASTEGYASVSVTYPEGDPNSYKSITLGGNRGMVFQNLPLTEGAQIEIYGDEVTFSRYGGLMPQYQ